MTGTHSWSDPSGRFTASVRVQDGTVLLLFNGRLDAATVRTGHLALAAAVRKRTLRVTVDLGPTILDRQSIDPLVSLIRAASRFGVVLQLRSLPVILRRVLARAAPASSYVLERLLDSTSEGPDVQLSDDERSALRVSQDFQAYPDVVVIEVRRRRSHRSHRNHRLLRDSRA